MDKEIKSKWLKALRSGRYKQTQTMLKDDIGYCCLGVLCTVVGAKWREDPHDEYMRAVLDGKVINEPGSEVLRLVFLRKIGLTKVRQEVLTNMNDGNGNKGVPAHSFKQIADYIEKNL